MANKKISEFSKVTSSQPSDLFLINQLGSTSTIAMSTVTNTIIDGLDSTTSIAKLSSIFIKKPTSGNNGDVLTLNSTGLWVASAAPISSPSGASIKAWAKWTEVSKVVYSLVGYNVSTITVNNTNRIINFTNPINGDYIVIPNGKNPDKLDDDFGNNYSAEGISKTSNYCYVNYYASGSKGVKLSVVVIG
jgi:hypothetical protein